MWIEFSGGVWNSISFCLFGSALFSCSKHGLVNSKYILTWKAQYEILVSGPRDSVIHLPSLVHNILFLLPYLVLKFQLKTSQSLAEYMRSITQNHYFSELLLRACKISLELPFPASVFISKDQHACTLFIFFNW